MVALPILAFLLLFLLMRAVSPLGEWRRDILRASVLWMSYLVVMTEALGVLRLITLSGLVIGWSLPILILSYALLRGGLYKAIPSVRVPAMRVLSGFRGLFVLGCALVALDTAVVAWFAPPNTWDSLNYHMARVAHWAQNRTIGPYPTGIEVQNGMPPGAEFIVLHSYVLAQGDRYANYVQWFCMVASLIAVSLVAAQLGVSPAGQAAAALVAATIPMGIVQASSTMTDYAVAYWVTVAASEALATVSEPETPPPWIFFGLASGFAMLTKPTAIAFLAPIGGWIVVRAIVRTNLRAAALYVGLSAFLAFSVSAAFLYQNYRLYDYPFGAPQSATEHRNELITWRGMVSNVLKHASTQAGTPWPPVNDLIYRGIVKIHLLMGIRPSDPRTTSIGPWQIWPPTTVETRTANALHAYTFVAVGVLLLALRARVGTLTMVYTIIVCSTFVLFASLFKWQVYSSRYHLPFFVLFAPIVGLVLFDFNPLRLGRVVPVVMLLLSWSWLVGVGERPLIPLGGTPLRYSILLTPREQLYWGQYDAMKPMVEMIQAAHCENVGIMLGGNSAEYVLWALLGAPRNDLHMEWIVTGTPSERYRDPAFRPCAIVCQYCPPEWIETRGLPMKYEAPPFRLFLRNVDPTTTGDRKDMAMGQGRHGWAGSKNSAETVAQVGVGSLFDLSLKPAGGNRVPSDMRGAPSLRE